jgi:Flp pilus assembly protein TadG
MAGIRERSLACRLRLAAASNGNIAIMSAIILPLVMLVASAAVDFQRWGTQRARLQEFADMLALRGAREFMLANAQVSQVKAIVEAAAESGLPNDLHIGPFTFEVGVDADQASVTVTVVQPPQDALILSHIASYSDDISVDATAVARGGMKVCVVALQEAGGAAVSADDEAVLDATPCSILSNSKASDGIAADKDSKIKAGMICSVGGTSGPSTNFTPAPTTDCPPYPDPLAQRPPPPVGPCDHFNFEVGYTTSGGTQQGSGGLLGGLGGTVESVVESTAELAQLPLIQQQVYPGVYCGGLIIKAKARVVFNPGIYVIKDGPLSVGEASVLDGANIAIYLLGDMSTFQFDPAASISMSAPKTGPLAGILFFEDRKAPLDRIHRILSEDAREFLGTFYLSRGILEVDTQNPVADSSAYTALVVRKLSLKGGPTLVLNADYASSDVPVPDGVGPVGGEVYLRD